ncbi:MAG: signal peptidase II [Myxococcales bacterium]|nr:signal peptidase II [Myxococcales bacterium]
MPLLRRLLLFFGVTVVSMAVDQATKQVATAALKGQPPRMYLGDVVRLLWAQNEGAFLSLGASLPDGARYWVLTIGVGVLLLSLTVYALASKALDGIQVASYALIASGGFSNWIDRARFDGSVVDFMQLGIGATPLTGVFNVADLAILGGIGVLFWHGWRAERRAKALAKSAGGAPGPDASSRGSPPGT